MTALISANPATTFPTPPSVLQTTNSTTAGSINSKDSLNQTFNQFLTLLTTQLKNQDPLSPMDSTEFTNQLVSFSQVEQQLRTNDTLTKLLSNSSASQTSLGLSYIGLNVDMQGTTFSYPGAGDSKMSYNLSTAASINTISVLDKDGATVYSQTGDTSIGMHDFTWNGKDQSGKQLPVGTYQLRVSALDKDNKNITVTTTVPGYVQGIQTASDGSIMLIINNQQVPMSSITKATL